MTREQWEEQIETMGDLIDFCRNEEPGYDYMVEDIECRDYVFDDLVYDNIREFDGSWRDLRDHLNDLDDDYDWYRVEGWFDFSPMDDYDFDRLKDSLLDRLIEDEYFEEEEVVGDGVDPAVFDDPTPETNASARFPWQWNKPAEEPEMEVLSIDGISALSEMSVCNSEGGDVAWDDVSRMC